LSYAPGNTAVQRWSAPPESHVRDERRLPQVGRVGRLMPQRPLIVGVLDLLGDVASHSEDADQDKQLLPHEQTP